MVEQYASVRGANGFMPFTLGKIDTYVIGGPFRNFETAKHIVRVETGAALKGVLMAEELGYLPKDVFVPTVDFQTPEVKDVRKALMQSIALMAVGHQLYVGCMGGIGRTGLFLAALAKIMGTEDPVAYVRSHYIPHAVETEAQQQFIADLKVEDIQKWARLVV